MKSGTFTRIPDPKLMHTVWAIMEAEAEFNENPEYYETITMRPSEEAAWDFEKTFPPATLVKQSSRQLIRDIKAIHRQEVTNPKLPRPRKPPRPADSYIPKTKRTRWCEECLHTERQKEQMLAEAEQAALDFPNYQLELRDAASSQEP